nr:MAG TPA: hypothetical protein [Caudoviricetes sp.]
MIRKNLMTKTAYIIRMGSTGNISVSPHGTTQ